MKRAIPNCILHRSDPSDVARTEQVTFICSRRKEDAGPTNNWMAPEEAKEKIGALFDGAMAGRTMYVVPYLMGPADSPMTRAGVEVTDSPYVVASMRIMARIGKIALDRIGKHERLCARAAFAGRSGSFAAFRPALSGRKTDLEHRLGLRRQRAAGQEMLRAAHRELDGARTGLDGGAHADPGPGRSVGQSDVHGGGISERLREDESGDDGVGARGFGLPGVDRWATTSPGCRPGADGYLHAINPEAGFFGVAPGTNAHTNPNVMAAVKRKHDLHERGHDGFARALVGRDDRRARPRN